MTYFFTVPRLKFNADDYVKFLRPGVPVAAFEGQGLLSGLRLLR
jgi:hypothetical protein